MIRILPATQRDARRMMVGGFLLILLAMAANWALGGTGGAVWLVLVLLGFAACALSLVYMISHPIQRKK